VAITLGVTKMRGQKGEGVGFEPLKSHLTADISKMGKSERYTNYAYMSISAEHQLNESFLKM